MTPSYGPVSLMPPATPAFFAISAPSGVHVKFIGWFMLSSQFSHKFSDSWVAALIRELVRQLIQFLKCYTAAQTKQGDQRNDVLMAYDTRLWPGLGWRSGCMMKYFLAHSLS